LGGGYLNDYSGHTFPSCGTYFHWPPSQANAALFTRGWPN
jgi:hypothetical protein